MNILMSNAFESWAMAIKYHNYILDGWISLNTKKVFVQSLHNACELILKQIMLNTKNSNIICKDENIKYWLKELETSSDPNDFNSYFATLKEEPRTIAFSKIINDLEKVLKSIPNGDEELFELIKTKITKTLKNNLRILNDLRNNSTHFYIKSTDFLSEDEFGKLHNLMFGISDLMEYYELLSFWGGEPHDEDARLFFDTKKVKKTTGFQYGELIKNNERNKKIINDLIEMSPYSSDDILWDCKSVYVDNEYNKVFSLDFDEFYSRVKMLFDFNILEMGYIEIPNEDELGNEYMDSRYFLHYNS